MLSLTGDGFSYAELEEVADAARNEFLRLPDVAKVDIYGIQEERVFIEYENARLRELSLAPSELSNILESQNIVTPGGNTSIDPDVFFATSANPVGGASTSGCRWTPRTRWFSRTWE